jgi:nitrile hydratase beta subunit
MNGAQDLGGQHGFGAVAPEVDEPLFHAAWERRALALTLAMGATGSWTIDTSRHARERMPPADYLSSSYYEIWIAGLERLLVEQGLATADEIAAGRSLAPPAPVKRVLAAADVPAVLARGGPTERAATAPARFAVGDAVTTRLANPLGHTRLPRYLRGRPGVIERVQGVHVFPDTNAHGAGEAPAWLYAVRFAAEDLWGADAEPATEIVADLFEPYLTPG